MIIITNIQILQAQGPKTQPKSLHLGWDDDGLGVEPLTVVFDMIYTHKIDPEQWLQSKVIPIQRYVKIQTIDNQPPVSYLAIRQRSEDPKHLIPGIGPTELQG